MEQTLEPNQSDGIISTPLPNKGLPHVYTWILMLFHQRPFPLNPLQIGTLKSFCEGLSKPFLKYKYI